MFINCLRIETAIAQQATEQTVPPAKIEYRLQS